MSPAIFIFGLLAFVSAGPGKLPEGTPKCKRSDPNLDECLKNAIQVAFPKMTRGIPKLGMLSLDPLMITALDVAQGTGGSVSIDLKFRDLVMSGLKNLTVTKVRSDLDNYKLEIHIFLPPPLIFDSKYELKGNVLFLPLAGKGQSHLTLDNLKASITLSGKENKKRGRIYMQINDLKVEYETSKLHMNFEGLLSQDKNLGDNLNTFLNENWEEIHKEVQPGISEALGAAFKEIASRLFSKVPFDDIFLP